MRPRTVFGLCAASLALACGSAQAAVTRVVDDNRAQCPTATFTSIQAAVNASGPGDTVRICAGAYRGHVNVPSGKDGLQLTAAVPFAPGLSPTKPNTPVIDISSRSISVRGLTISGSWPAGISCRAINRALESGVRIESGGSADVIGNRLLNLRHVGCPQVGIGVIYTFVTSCDRQTGGTVAGNQITGYAHQGVVVYCGSVTVRDNTVHGFAPGARDGLYVYYFGAATMTGNDVAGNARGVRLTGFGLSNPFNVVDSNQVHDNRLGVFLEDDAVGWRITRNVLRGNREHGLMTMGAGSVFDHNDVAGSIVDCSDASARDHVPLRNVWTNDIGATAIPAGICKPAS